MQPGKMWPPAPQILPVACVRSAKVRPYPRARDRDSVETRSLIERLRSTLDPLSDGDSLHRLPAVAALAAELAAGLGTSSDEDIAWWARALDRQCRDHFTTLNLLAPWLLLPPEDVQNGAAAHERLRPRKIPTLGEVAQSGPGN